MNLSVKHLRAFVALATYRNFTRAARACHLSQSAFSALVQTLEEQAGSRLFERTTRHVELSSDGVRFEQTARRLLADFETAFEDLRAHAERRKGRVSIAALPSLAGGDLPPLLAQFRARYPGIVLELFDQLADGCIELVRQGRADFALAPAPAQDDDLRVEPLVRDTFHLVCPADHALARKRRITPEMLAGLPFIQLSRTTSVRQHLDAALHPLRLASVMEVEHLATVAALVQAGLGISAVPSLALFQFRREGLAIRPLQLPSLVRDICLVRLKDRSDSAAAAAMIESLQAFYRGGKTPARR
ncbi:putative transcriptional regulator, LysR family [Cupriavidus taiwanensis]|uniref:LysR family transcriptional regulator n=1 Tax=Cupriavidus taiwanensis TaxID=164546 RepID=UPI000E120CBC|nr:LysR family transcriptional regulator [Cupriavidus taiwanensis]SOZ17601.1 putative transcriptional regulator, LysR family [Cupriavidus taiwanensis]SOZ29965.1 putative transcriptional regulator, LysR family [Cupriavidus taiwanensis]SOZ47021.1 putative transcriptional regulator, LysR family [Cupriavidus taiwanensis]SPA00985.1 putative transcriptional regulator, LysR family [Cupriavidus taiwanensis]SPA18911.1 putative transcriptional regulator, LysR family [Cupriavidus taiwanensis]